MSVLSSDYFLEDLQRYKDETGSVEPYGYERGNPFECSKLQRFLTNYVFPYVCSTRTACEIGSGGGRITQFLRGFSTIYAVDYIPEMHDIREKHFKIPQVVSVTTDNGNLPGVALLDYVLSFDTFIYCNPQELSAYLKSIAPYLRPGASVVFNFGSSRASKIKHSTRYRYQTMESIVTDADYAIEEYDNTTLDDTDIIRIVPRVS